MPMRNYRQNILQRDIDPEGTSNLVGVYYARPWGSVNSTGKYELGWSIYGIKGEMLHSVKIRFLLA